MNNNIGKKIGMLFVCINVLILSGCANFLKPDLGAIARVDARVPLVDDQINNGVFETKDMRMEYTLSSNGDIFNFNGVLVFSRGITSSYPMLSRFTMRLNFLGTDGAVLQTINIAPNIRTFYEVPDRIQVKASGVRPVGTSGITFNYYGTFMEQSFRGGGAGHWEAFFMPFDRAEQ